MTYPIQITDNGVIAPTYEESLSFFQGVFRSIYGQDINLDADTSDGQMVAILAKAYTDTCAQIVASYAGYAPSTASGVQLSSVVKVNGIARYVPTQSTADVQIVGQAGTVISGGIVEDVNGYRWNLPDSVIIPVNGEITVTATCQEEGSIPAEPNTITQIITPTLGWQSVTNPDAATEGNPVETDAQLRQRQSQSVALPSRSVTEGIIAGIEALNGVVAINWDDNDTDETDSNGVPAHSISVVVDGGDAQEIAQTILLKKGPGCGTYGDTTIAVVDSYGRTNNISFSRPDVVQVKVQVTIQPLSGYESDIGDQIQQAVTDYINGLGIGESVILTRLYLPSSLCGTNMIQYYKLVSVEIAQGDGGYSTSDIDIAYNEQAQTSLDNVEIVVQS